MCQLEDSCSVRGVFKCNVLADMWHSRTFVASMLGLFGPGLKEPNISLHQIFFFFLLFLQFYIGGSEVSVVLKCWLGKTATTFCFCSTNISPSIFSTGIFDVITYLV